MADYNVASPLYFILIHLYRHVSLEFTKYICLGEWVVDFFDVYVIPLLNQLIKDTFKTK